VPQPAAQDRGLSDRWIRPIEQNAETREKVVRRFRTGSMPPAGSRRPDQAGCNVDDSAESPSMRGDARAEPRPPSVHR
jgi:hypothetical protein